MPTTRDTVFITLTCKASYGYKFRTWPSRVHQTDSVHLMPIRIWSKATRHILKRDIPVLLWAGQPFVLWSVVKQLGRKGRARRTCSRNSVSSLPALSVAKSIGGTALSEVNRCTRRKPWPTVAVLTTNLTCTGLGMNPWLRREKPWHGW